MKTKRVPKGVKSFKIQHMLLPVSDAVDVREVHLDRWFYKAWGEGKFTTEEVELWPFVLKPPK